MEPKDALNLPMSENDAGADTIRDYFKRLLSELFDREESFSGKRPFGNSGWQWDVATALVAGKALDGELDSGGYIQAFDADAFDALVQEMIEAL